MTRFKCELLVLALAFSSLPVAATPIEWELSARFDGGGTAEGTFVYDLSIFDAGLVSDWDIRVFGGDEATFPPFEYTPANSGAGGAPSMPGRQPFLNFGGPFVVIEPGQPARPRQLRITPSLALDGLVDLVPLFTMLNNVDLGAEECYNCAPFRHIGSGFLQRIAPAVPEPAPLVLAAAGALALMVFRRRRVAVTR